MRYLQTPALLLCCFLSAQVQAQNSFQSGSPYTGTTVTVNGNDVMLPAYAATKDKFEGSTYFSKEWVAGSVTTTDNTVFSANILFMYDKMNNELYYKKRDSQTTWKVDLTKVSGFSLQTDRPHIFMRADYFNKDYTGQYFEVLLLDEKKYSLLKYMKVTYEENISSKGSQAMNQNFSTGKYVDNIKYFLFKDGISTEVTLKKKRFEEALGADSEKAQAYFKDHGGSFNEQAAVSLIAEVNSQLN